jgi:phosphoribosylanthranilate isomerase
MKIKVCGVKNPEHLREISMLENQIDWIGINFVDTSPRKYNMERVPSGIQEKLVGVFQNHSHTFIEAVCIQFGIKTIQLHGQEDDAFMAKLHHKYTIIKAINIYETGDFNQCKKYKYVHYFLFDSKSLLGGGSGKHFDWRLLNNYNFDTPFILAGGISSSDIEAIKSINHDKLIGIDINSKFEISPGIKDLQKVNSLVRELRLIQKKCVKL